MAQVSTTTETSENEEPLLVFNDKGLFLFLCFFFDRYVGSFSDSSDSDEEEIELMEAHSDSDNEWVEESDEEMAVEDNNDENASSSGSDVEEML